MGGRRLSDPLHDLPQTPPQTPPQAPPQAPGRQAAARQSRASDPAVSAWVSASAGSGKTKLLTDRVLRLMLAGTTPSRILCLTFTKAAAAEMAVRLNRELGRWAVADDAGLAAELAALLTRPPTPAEAAGARTLFAEVLELAGGMRILTIHAFCQTLLRAFPLEAGLPPQFTVLEEADALATLANAREDVLGDAAGGAALEALAGLVSAERFAGLSHEIAQGSGALEAVLAAHGIEGICARLTDALGAAADPDQGIDAVATEADDAALNRAAAALLNSGTDSDRARGATMREWLAATPTLRAPLFSTWRQVFLTQECTVKKNLATKGGLGGAIQSWVQPIMQAEGERVLAAWHRITAASIVASTRALLLLAQPILRRYDAAKKLTGRLDFDDLITATRTLLSDPGSAWVLFKLDRGIDHVLLDEAQDSNPAQWGIVRALTAEFFAGEGATQSSRSVFAVGDVKQSIFSFQGADPAGFGENAAHFGNAVRAAKGEFRAVPLDVSFRSAPPVLALVDAVFADPASADGVTPEGAPLRHVAHRQDAAGMVELWPLLVAEQPDKPGPWEVREDATAAQAQTTLARALARRIRQMIDHETLPARSDGPDQPQGRRIRPGDILILVRRRNALTRLMIRELKQAGVPVGGLDRIRLAEQIAVMDVLALLDVLLLPGDDLALAALLKSPLVGLDEEALFGLAHGRPGSLHGALMAHRGSAGALAAAAEWLAGWEAAADQATPHALLARLLGADGGRARLLSRLGPDATDGLDELLNAALAHEARHPPSLQGFVHWLRSGNAEVKRQPEGAGGPGGGPGGGNVRIMTAHNAKGLQAPIVILPDTTGQKPRDAGLRWAAPDLPLWTPRLDKPVCEAMRDLGVAEQDRARREENRLLYVALTRAEDRLLVCGWAREPGRNTEWYDQIRRGFDVLGAEALEFDGGFPGDLRRLATAQRGAPPQETAARQPQAAGLPGWAATPARPEGAEASTAPSSLLDEETGSPAAAPHAPSDPRGVRFQRGRLIHALLQHLPALPVLARAPAAARFLARPGHGLAPAAQAELTVEVMALLQDARFNQAFGPDSLTEAPIAGRIGGRLLAGQVDRLLVAADRVQLIDYKTNRPPPGTAAEVSPAYLRQMAAYRALLRLAFPGRAVECALLWTYSARLMPLPDDLLDSHAPGYPSPS